VELGAHDEERIAAAATVVVSPGIPPDAPLLRALRHRGVRWISEPEFAYRFYRRPLIAVTGTNGKTTTAALTAHLLEEAGVSVGLGGNIGGGLGPPASDLARMTPQPDWFVVEMSSFQLADIDTFAPDIGVVTNLAPDHLDRYTSVEAYYADKARLFDNATPDSRWVLYQDDPAVQDLADDAPGRRYGFGTADGFEGGHLAGDALELRMEGRVDPLGDARRLPLMGRHNALNALAASVAARLAGAEPEDLRRGLGSFRPLPHRLTPVAEAGGVLWVNDSKATNVAAARSSVASMDRPLVVLLGGKDKGEDFAAALPKSGPPVRAVVAYGAAGPRIARALEDRVDVLPADGLSQAVARAREVAVPGDAVLLAPACSSFDEFNDYEERGRVFAALVRRDA
jgi:UDP-N-acetylmuramoylalanine--D-glutamate ligase